LYWNKSALEMHGFASLDEGRLAWPEFARIFELSDLDGEVLNVEQWPLARIIGGEQLSDLEVPIRRLDGDWDRIFRYSGNIVRETSGRPVAFLTITDITERKRAEEERRRLALLVESSEDAIIGKTLDGTITSWNKAAERLYGYPAGEVLGRPVSILAPPEGVDEVAVILERLRHGDTIDHFETERITRSGKRVFVSLTISPIRERSDAITGWSTSARDITESRAGEEALRNSEIRYRRLFESAHDGILILEADSGRIIDVNPYLVELLGTVKEDLLGRELWELGLFQDILASKAAFAELQERGYIRYDDLPLEGRDGVVRHVEFVSNSYLAGERRVIQCNIRDITERQVAEEDLRETNQRLEKALFELQNKTRELTTMTQQLWQASKLATMGELAASVAHELNNPLATISLHAEALLGQLAADDPHRQAMRVIEQEVDRMASLVSNLLLFSRRSHPQVSPLDICQELTSSLDLIEYSLRSHNIDIVLDCATVLPLVQADRQQLHQVFLNLITNASDAMPRGGTLTVRSREGVMAEGQAAVVVEFCDTGVGVQTGDLPKLWEPFFTTKPPGKGTGLGLAICRRTVEGHRGTIEIETGPGKGATVRITLPATDEDIEVAA
jgi:PAS domain S-box-containing protein